jgi:hypothetical protein
LVQPNCDTKINPISCLNIDRIIPNPPRNVRVYRYEIKQKQYRAKGRLRCSHLLKTWSLTNKSATYLNVKRKHLWLGRGRSRASVGNRAEFFSW